MRKFAKWILLLAAACLFTGCGGSGGSSSGNSKATGSAVIRIEWPGARATSRLIPASTQSIKVVFATSDTAVVVGSQVIQKPTNTATFTGLPPGNLTVTATAYPNLTSSGVAVAKAVGPVVIQPNITTPVSLTMNSTIIKLVVAPALLTTNVGVGLVVNGSANSGTALNVSAQDATGALVFVPLTNYLYASDQPTIVNPVVSASGDVSLVALKNGKANITITEIESNVSVVVPYTATYIYVTDPTGGKVWRIDNMTGANPTVIPLPAIAFKTSSPTGIFATADSIYVADKGTSQVVQVNFTTGVTTNYPGNQNGIPALNQPTAIWVDDNGRIYIADTGNNQIVRLDNILGANRLTYQGPASLKFAGPMGVAVDAAHHIYISDTGNSRVMRVNDITGAGLTTYAGTSANNSFGFFSPQGLFVNPDGQLYVADSALGSLLLLDKTGQNATPYSNYGTFSPTGVWVDVNDSNRVYIADNGDKRLIRDLFTFPPAVPPVPAPVVPPAVVFAGPPFVSIYGVAIR